MPPLVAAATECRLSLGRCTVGRRTNDPATGHPCSVRLHGELVLRHMVRAVGGRAGGRAVCADPPRQFDQVFYLYDPDTFFGSYNACSAIIHQMLAQTPVVGEFDLADDKWDHDYLPHTLANMIVSGFRRAMDQNMGVDPRCNFEVSMTVRVRAVYSEPKALLLACKEVTAAYCRFMAAQGPDAGLPTSRECGVCMEDLTPPTDSSSDTVMLPCSHVFHNQCLLPWFHRRSTCPMCRRNMIMYLVAATKTHKGKFPGLES